MELIKNLKIFKSKIEDFSILCTLGEGSYGEVYLVEKNDMSRHKYALKAINKKFIHVHGKARSVFLEKLFLKNLKHNQIVKLHDTFQDEERLYFLMEVISNGELADYVKLVSKFKRKNYLQKK